MERIARALTHPTFAVDDELVDYRYQLTLDEPVMDADRATMGWVREAGGLGPTARRRTKPGAILAGLNPPNVAGRGTD